MIYASERDAELARIIGPDAMWRQSGATGIRRVTAGSVDVGAALTTVVIRFDQSVFLVGTRVNTAVPLPFSPQNAQPNEDPVLTTPASMVEELREAFGLNVTQLAQILHIERITVYAWLRTETLEKLNQTNRARLWQLFRIAKQWRTYAPLAGKYLVEPIPDQDTTVLELLRGENPSPLIIAHAYEQLARATSPSLRIRQNQATQRTTLKTGIEKMRGNASKFGMILD